MSTVPMKAIRRPVLTARWSNLAILTYETPPALLEPHLPAGLALDTRGGTAFASLVAFDFLDTRVLGVPWPGFRDFPELNLRFYVKQGSRRGVVFIREFVPRLLVSWLARALYHEPYLVAPIDSRVDEGGAAVTTVRCLRWHGRDHRIEVTGDRPAGQPSEDSDEHFFKEHSWGYGTSRRGKLIRYEVSHPEWDVYPVREFAADVDWGTLYGPEWAVMNGAAPASVVLARGSEISVFPKGTG